MKIKQACRAIILLCAFHSLPASAQPIVANPPTAVQQIAAQQTAAQSNAAAPAKVKLGSETPQLAALSERTMWALGSLIMMFLLFAGVYKKVAEKRGLLNHSNQIQILSRKPVGPKHALLLVEVEGQRFFLAQSADSMNLVSEINALPEYSDAAADLEMFETRSVTRP